MAEIDKKMLSFERAVSIALIRNSGGFAVKATKGQKKPSAGWDPRMNTAAKSSQLLADMEYSDDNLGIHLHDDLIDVDVDGDDAARYLVPALDAFLPDCAHVWGRQSRPRTHRVYLLKTLEKFDPGEWPVLGRIKRIPEVKVEIRGGPVSRGEYSLLPSSVHPSGEVYTWADVARAKATPSIVAPDALIKAVRMAGAVAVLAPLWVEGLRQDLTMALAGFLHRAAGIAAALDDGMFKINQEEALRFLEVLLSVCDDDQSDRYARKKAFEKTWAKAEKGNAVTGASRLEELSGGKDVMRKLYVLLTDNPDIAVIDDFTARFAIWQGPALAVDIEAAAKGAQKPFMSRQNFASSYGHKFVEVGGKRKLLPEMLWSMSNAMRVQGLTFEPGQGKIVSNREGDLINQWAGFEVSPFSMPVPDEDVKPFTDYLWEVVASQDRAVYDWVVAWVADILKDPAHKAGTALVLVGVEGAGKSILGHAILGKIIGNGHYAATNSVDNVTKNFNVAFTKRVLVQCDEATNSRQKVVAARLKSLITDPIQLVEPKGVDPYTLPNHTRFMFTSNDVEDAIYMSSGRNDRRYTILEVSQRRVGEVAEYWQPFVEWLEQPETLSKIHRWLIDQPYDKRLIKLPVSTDARDRMQQSSWDPFDAWLAEMVERDHPLHESMHTAPYHAFPGDNPHGKTIERENWPDFVEWNQLAEDFKYFKKSNGYRGDVLNGTLISRGFEKRGIVAQDDKQMRPGVTTFDDRLNRNVTRRVRLRTPPSRAKIKQYLANKYGFHVQMVEAGGDAPSNETEEF